MDTRRVGLGALARLGAVAVLVALPLAGLGPSGAPVAPVAAAAGPPTITLTKAYGSERVEDTDQFAVAIVRNTIIVAEGTTTGAGSTVDPGSGTTGAFTAVAGTTYQLMELAQGTAESADYDATLDCIDANGVQTGLPDDAPFDTGGSADLTPVEGAAITCTITNTAREEPAPTIQVVKQLGEGRIADTDQFTVEVSAESGVLGTSTTTGAGAGIDAGTGDTGPVTVTAGERHVVGEAGAGTTDLDRYDARITCTDANGLQPGLPDDAALGPEGQEIEPTAGAAITCTITNTAIWPTIEVVKALGGDRVADTDQFTVEILSDDTVIADGTTTGTGSTVDAGTGTTGPETFGPGTTVVVRESVAGSTDLERYDAVITCVDEEGHADDLPGAEALGDGVEIDLPAAAAITCTITNTPAVTTTIEVVKALGSARVDAADQFTVLIGDGDTVVASGTSAGSGADVDPGTGTTGLHEVAAGTAYTVGEIGVGATDLGRYAATIDCTDANGLQAGLPDDEPFAGPVTIEPTSGAEISCTITNTAIPPTIVVQAVLATDRARPDDQLTVGISQPGLEQDLAPTAPRVAPGPDGPIVSDPVNATTAGTGSVVEPGSGTTGTYVAQAGVTYGIGVRGAGSTDIGPYLATLTCEDDTGLQPDLPLDAALTGTYSLVPVAGARITCTITNRVSTASDGSARITKELVGTSPVGPDGHDGHDVVYRLTVANIGEIPVAYDLDDELRFGAGITVTAATVDLTEPGHIALATEWDGVDRTRIVEAMPLAVDEVHVYEVRVRVVVTASATATSVDCAADPGETGTGVSNSATLGNTDTDAEVSVAVCGAVATRDPDAPPVTPAPPAASGPAGPGSLVRTGAALGLLAAIGLVLLGAGMLLSGSRLRRRPA